MMRTISLIFPPSAQRTLLETAIDPSYESLGYSQSSFDAKFLLRFENCTAELALTNAAGWLECGVTVLVAGVRTVTN